MLKFETTTLIKKKNETHHMYDVKIKILLHSNLYY